MIVLVKMLKKFMTTEKITKQLINQVEMEQIDYETNKNE